MKNIIFFLSENFRILVVTFSEYLNRLIFIMFIDMNRYAVYKYYLCQ